MSSLSKSTFPLIIFYGPLTDSSIGELRRGLAAFYSTMGRPSIDPELMIRMLIVGYCFSIRSERRLCEEAVTWHARSQVRGKAAPRDDCARK
jgi:hypothetical protein